jgi:ribosomal protein S18 acetylase RimI-like enzyme
MHDEVHVIKGFVWAEIDLIEKLLYIQALSVDREYQGVNRDVEKAVADEMFKIIDQSKDFGLKNKIVMTTTRPKALEKAG